MKVLFGINRVELMQGDITRQEVDAIVNAANSELAGGGVLMELSTWRLVPA